VILKFNRETICRYMDTADHGTQEESLSAGTKPFLSVFFPILPKSSGRGTKKGAVVVRVSGPTSRPDDVVAKAKEIVDMLDRGEYTGTKRVRVK